MKSIVRTLVWISALLLLAGCAKRGIVGNCEQGDYEGFLHTYPEQYVIDSLRGNGSFEMWREEMQYTGNFSISYDEQPRRWKVSFYGFFGMLLSTMSISSDSFSIFSPFLDKPMKGLIQNFTIEDYIGIPLDAYSVQQLTTGRVPFDPSLVPSRCARKNELLEFTFETDAMRNTIVWSPINNQVVRFTSGKKSGKGMLEVSFSNYEDASEKPLPHAITFTYRGREEAYLKLNYKYLEAR
jgi:hypothetical protein